MIIIIIFYGEAVRLVEQLLGVRFGRHLEMRKRSKIDLDGRGLKLMVLCGPGCQKCMPVLFILMNLALGPIPFVGSIIHAAT